MKRKSAKKKSCERMHVDQVSSHALRNHTLWQLGPNEKLLLVPSSVIVALSAMGLDKVAAEFAVLAASQESGMIHEAIKKQPSRS